MFCPEFSLLHLYRWVKGEPLNLHIKTSISGSFQSFNFTFFWSVVIVMGQSKLLVAKKKEKEKEKKRHPDLINKTNKV
jgi:hypothetical protein